MWWHHIQSFLPGTSFIFLQGSQDLRRQCLHPHSPHNCQKVSNHLILWRPTSPPHILPSPPISNFVHNPLPCLQAPLELLSLLPCFFGWMGECTTFCVIFLNDIMDLYVHLEPWYLTTWSTLFYATRRHFCGGLARNMFFCWYSKLLSHTHTQSETQHIQIYINTTCYVLTVAICITLNE